MSIALDTQRPIAVTERCDKCGAQAMVRAILANGELYFCGHHARKTGNKLVLNSLQVVDPNGVFNYGRQ
jgi:hypothetical protein